MGHYDDCTGDYEDKHPIYPSKSLTKIVSDHIKSTSTYDSLLIKPPLGLRPKYIAYSERLKEINAAIGRYLDAGQVIPQEWIDEFSILNSEI